MGAVSLTNPQVESESKPVTVCLAGMPNAGKTTLMNALTGGRFHTANYPGATVSMLRGRTRPEFGTQVAVVDLPGVNSTAAPSPDEEIACRVITGAENSVKPDAVISVVDVTQLERHLKFAAFVAAQGRPVVIALTMSDLLARSGQAVDPEKLGAALGVPVVLIDARSGTGVDKLLSAIRAAVSLGPRESILAGIPHDPVTGYETTRQLIAKSGALSTTRRQKAHSDTLSARIDRFVFHKYWGFPIFFVVLIGLFAAIFWIARPFMDGVDAAFGGTARLTLKVLPDSAAARFLAEGLIGGIGSVAVFFPQIIILFFLMTLLEDSGYLARAAALVDRPLTFLGLHGRSFVPMLSGFACAIPAVFAARTIPSKRERLLTIWILPLMSCSARLPVYALLLAAVFPGAAWKAGMALALIYLLSLFISAVCAGLIGRLLPRKRTLSVLAMELPIYRKPQMKPILRATWTRSSAYLRRAATPIVIISACLWLLSNFGAGAHQPQPEPQQRQPLVVSTGLESSFLAELGHGIAPVLHPMQVDWRVGVGLLSGFAAREVFVSSMAVVFHASGDETAGQEGLLEQMRQATFAGSTKKIFTTATVVGLIVFFFFSLQCLSTVAVVRSETNSWVFAGAQLLFYTGIGYLAAVVTVQGLHLLGIS